MNVIQQSDAADQAQFQILGGGESAQFAAHVDGAWLAPQIGISFHAKLQFLSEEKMKKNTKGKNKIDSFPRDGHVSEYPTNSALWLRQAYGCISLGLM